MSTTISNPTLSRHRSLRVIMYRLQELITNVLLNCFGLIRRAGPTRMLASPLDGCGSGGRINTDARIAKLRLLADKLGYVV